MNCFRIFRYLSNLLLIFSILLVNSCGRNSESSISSTPVGYSDPDCKEIMSIVLTGELAEATRSSSARLPCDPIVAAFVRKLNSTNVGDRTELIKEKTKTTLGSLQKAIENWNKNPAKALKIDDGHVAVLHHLVLVSIALKDWNPKVQNLLTTADWKILVEGFESYWEIIRRYNSSSEQQRIELEKAITVTDVNGQVIKLFSNYSNLIQSTLLEFDNQKLFAKFDNHMISVSENSILRGSDILEGWKKIFLSICNPNSSDSNGSCQITVEDSFLPVLYSRKPNIFKSVSEDGIENWKSVQIFRDSSELFKMTENIGWLDQKMISSKIYDCETADNYRENGVYLQGECPGHRAIIETWVMPIAISLVKEARDNGINTDRYVSYAAMFNSRDSISLIHSISDRQPSFLNNLMTSLKYSQIADAAIDTNSSFPERFDSFLYLEAGRTTPDMNRHVLSRYQCYWSKQTNIFSMDGIETSNFLDSSRQLAAIAYNFTRLFDSTERQNETYQNGFWTRVTRNNGLFSCRDARGLDQTVSFMDFLFIRDQLGPWYSPL